MALDETSSITGRWFVDSDTPIASEDLTREIRDIDMLPTDELDEKLLGHGLSYRDVRLGGARLLPLETSRGFDDDEQTDAHQIEDPFEPSASSVELPQTWAGSVHARLARQIERALEAWESDRPGVRGMAAAVTLAATMLTIVVGVIVGAAAMGSSVQADGPDAPPKSLVAQQRALSQFAVEWATSQRPETDDMTFTVDEATAEEPEVETTERRIARAERAERRREARRRRVRRR